MCKQIFRIVVSLVVAITVFLIGGWITAQASEIPTSGLQAGDATITDMTGQSMTHDDVLDKWSSYLVHYNWQIPDGHPIGAGDTATVTLPTGAVAETDITIPLLDDNQREVGTFTIKAGEQTGTITFNNSLSTTGTNREGTLQFYVRGNTNTNHSDQDWGINKVGWIGERDTMGLPTRLTWNVAFNPTSQTIGTAVVTDTLGPNQVYVPGSVYAETGSYQANGQFTATGTTTPTVAVSGQQLTLTFTDVKTAINLVYQTTPSLADGGGTWTNQANWNGQTVSAHIAWGGSGSGGGTGTETAGAVMLTKSDDSSGKSLAGAVYRLEKADGSVVATNLTTNDDGRVVYTQLSAGDYQFVEVTPPAGYALNSTPIPFTIVTGQVTPVTVYASDEEIPTPGGGDTGTVTPPITTPQGPDEGHVPEPPTPETPTNPVNPTKPTRPTKPIKPTTPTKPVIPQQPTEPTKPTHPNQSASSTGPSQSGTFPGSNPVQNGSSQASTPFGNGTTSSSQIITGAGTSPSASQQPAGLPQTSDQRATARDWLGWMLLGSVVAIVLIVGIRRKQRR